MATSLPAYALYTTVEGGQAPNIRKEITQIDDGRWEIVFDDVLPTDFYVDYYIGIYDEAGNKLTNFINYSIKAYVSMNDNENRDREYDSVGLEEPVGPINDLVKSLQMYCIAAIEYEKSL